MIEVCFFRINHDERLSLGLYDCEYSSSIMSLRVLRKLQASKDLDPALSQDLSETCSEKSADDDLQDNVKVLNNRFNLVSRFLKVMCPARFILREYEHSLFFL